MKQYIGEKCKIHIKRGEKDLFYTAKILDVNETHMTFIDKYDKKYSFRITEIIELRSL